MSEFEIKIGERVRVGTEVATVKYIGEIFGYGAQIWVGLDWDNPERGKHNGVVKNMRYFITKHPTSGSFIKLECVKKPMDLLEVIKDKYVDRYENEKEGGTSESPDDVEWFVSKKKKDGNIFNLKSVTLDFQCVGHPPPEGTPKFQLCQELTLTRNLIYKWYTLKKILKVFPKVEEINIGGNKMMKYYEDMDLKKDEKSLPSQYLNFSTSCKVLAISRCNITDDSINPILQRFPSVHSVIVYGNELTRFCVGPDVSNRLQSLDISNNPLCNIDNIVGTYPNLTYLNISECGIITLRDLEGLSKFPKLETLNVSCNEICDWRSINSLKTLGLLKKLSIDCKNFCTGQGINVFEVIISKLPHLEDLNKLIISEIERRSAEIRFLNKYFAVNEEVKIDHQEDVDRLVKIYGEPCVDQTKKGLTVIKINIEYDGKVETRRLPITMNVQKIKDMLRRLFKIETTDIRIYLRTVNEEGEEHKVELDNSLRQFGHYSPVENRDVLLVEVD